MTICDLVPFKKGRRNVAVKRSEFGRPFYELHHQMHRAFDDIFGDFETGQFGGPREWADEFVPSTTVTEDEKEFWVYMELPGLDEKDIEISLIGNALMVRGEKKQEYKDEGKDYYRRERLYGAFSRSIELGCEVDEAKVTAEFKKGVLSIQLPKAAKVLEKAKKIQIKGI